MSLIALTAQCSGMVAPVIPIGQKTYKMSPNSRGVRAERDLWRFNVGMPCYVRGWPQHEATITGKVEGCSWPTYLVQNFATGATYQISQLYLSKRPIDAR
jgi:GH18 family chitinase